MRTPIALATVGVLLIVVAACGSDSEATPVPNETAAATVAPKPAAIPVPEGFVMQAEYGDEWPFAFASGTLACDNDVATIVGVNGIEYALNGVALTAGFEALDDDSEVWLADPSSGAKKSISDMTTQALALCE